MSTPVKLTTMTIANPTRENRETMSARDGDPQMSTADRLMEWLAEEVRKAHGSALLLKGTTIDCEGLPEVDA